MIDELSRCFPNKFCILGHATGLHLVVRFQYIFFTEETEKRLQDNGVRIYRPEPFYLNKSLSHNNEVIMGYSHLSFEEIVRGVDTISNYLGPGD